MALDISFACEDWAEKLAKGETPIPDLVLNERLAGDAIRCFDQLHIPDIIGMPTFGDVGGDWFRDIIGAAFGCIDPDTYFEDPETGDVDYEQLVRLIGEIFLLVPKKNSKTTNSAGLGLTALILNRVPNASMLIVGPTQKVAETCFNQARGMINADEKLRQVLQVQEHRQRIKNLITGAVLEIKTFDMNVLTGAIPIFAIIDELHLMSSKSYAKKVIGQIRGGMTKKNCLLVFITTQSTDAPAGVFKTELTNAREIRDGIGPSENVLPVLYEFPESMQIDEAKPWEDPKYWPMVLPNLGKSVRIDWLEREFRKAKRKEADDVQLWLSQHLNIQVGLGLHNDRWRGADLWEDQADQTLTLEEIMHRCDVAVVGVDGGGLDDLFAIAIAGRCRETREWLFWFHAWAQTEVFERRKEISERLQDFVKQKDLTVCPDDDPGMDFREAAEYILLLKNANLLPEEKGIGLDPFGISELHDILLEAGVEPEQITGIPQGVKLSSAIWGMERKLKDKTMWHSGSNFMDWIVGNAKAEQRGNAIYVSKQAAGKAKIDPLTAGFNAFMLMALNPEPAGRGSVLLDMDGVCV